VAIRISRRAGVVMKDRVFALVELT
jgi:hypothetical protein